MSQTDKNRADPVRQYISILLFLFDTYTHFGIINVIFYKRYPFISKLKSSRKNVQTMKLVQYARVS